LPVLAVIERRQHLRFTTESRQAIGIVGDRRQQHLYCNIAIQLRIAGAIHLAHSADAECGKDLVRTAMATRLQFTSIRL